jgi:guanylate kinase
VIIIKTKFLIVAPSGAGKDRIANKLADVYDLKILKSYTTRPRRFPEEDSHIFIDVDTAHFIKMNEIIVAYTEIGEYEYFSTLPQFLDADIYIIDPQGIEYLENHQHLITDIRLVKIYIKTDFQIRQQRVLEHRKDNQQVYQSRTKAEYNQFDNFLRNEKFDWVVNNNVLQDCWYVISSLFELYL